MPMDMNGYNSQDRGLFPSTTITDQIILMWEVLQFLGWKEVQKMKELVPDIHVPSLLKKVFDNLISYVKVIRRSIPPLTFSRSKRIEAKKLYYSDAEFSNLEEIPSERVLALEAEIEILKSQLNTIMKIINKDEGFQDENLFKNMNTQNSNYFSSSMPVARSFTDSFHPDFENNFIHLNPDASNLAPMAKNPPLAPPLPDFLKEIPDFDSDSTTTSVSDKDSLESSSISKALFEEMKSVKLKTVSSSCKSSAKKYINDDYDYLRKALDDKFRNANFDDFSRDSTTWDE